MNLYNNLKKTLLKQDLFIIYMGTIVYILIGIALLVLIATIFIAKKMKKEETYKETDYPAFFIMGISFLPMGIIFSAAINPAFIGFVGMGIIYMAIGLANRDKWKKEE